MFRQHLFFLDNYKTAFSTFIQINRQFVIGHFATYLSKIFSVHSQFSTNKNSFSELTQPLIFVSATGCRKQYS